MNWTEEQQAVINHHGRHAIVTAVAGSGKTSTLVAHVLNQLEKGQDPARMLVLMFNRSAREDFQNKLSRLAQSDYVLPDIRTYHSMGLRLYRHFVHQGWLPQWRGQPLSGPAMDMECWKILQRIAPASLQDALKSDKSSWVSELTGFIDLVKSTTSTPEQIFEAYDYGPRKKIVLEGYHAFEQWRREQGVITYADMLHEPVMLMLREPQLVERVTNRMDVMLVDEYQDTNEIQHTLLRMIAGRRAQVMVVGDPDQTIYEFRGARPEYILKTFAEDFPGPVHYQLSYTFRYGHNLALVANHLITNNTGRDNTLCIAHNTTRPTTVEKVAKRDHARWLAGHVKQLNASGFELQDITVLVRQWSQSVAIELALLEAGVPFVSEAEKGAFERKEIRVLLTLLELASGAYEQMNEDERFQNFWLLFRFPHVGIKDQWLQQFCRNLAQNSKGFGQWIVNLASSGHTGLTDFQGNRLLERGRLLAGIEKGSALAARLLDSYMSAVEMKKWLQDSALDRERADEQLSAMHSFIRYLASTGHKPAEACDFLNQLRDRKNSNVSRNGQKKPQALLLTSIHKAKGLEWPVVIIPGLSDRMLPCSNGDDPLTAAELESERRLFYVAMTRAKQQLYLVTVPSPEAGRQAFSADSMPSRFMRELNHELSRMVANRLDNRKDDETVLDLEYPQSVIVDQYLAREFPALNARWGQEQKKTAQFLPAWQKERVEHSIFGEGLVLSETSSDFKVRFDEGSTYDFSKKSAHLYFL